MQLVRRGTDPRALADGVLDGWVAVVSEAAIAIATGFIADREGFRAEPYQDSGRGVWTIGYGFTYSADGSPVGPHTPPVTREDAYARLQGMVARVVASVQQMVAVRVTDNQLAALASFAFNEGTHALRGSTLLELLNQGRPEQAAEQFAAWVYAGGKVSHGLVNRRHMEAALFLRPDDPTPVAADPDHSADALMAVEEQRLAAGDAS